MANKRTAINPNCTCGCNAATEVLTATQLDNQAVLSPENLENKDKILVLSKNINNAYMVKVMSTLTVNDLVKAINNPEVAFLMVEMKEPAAPVDPENPDTTTPETPDPGTGEGGGTETTDPETPSTGESGENTGGEGGTV